METYIFPVNQNYTARTFTMKGITCPVYLWDNREFLPCLAVANLLGMSWEALEPSVADMTEVYDFQGNYALDVAFWYTMLVYRGNYPTWETFDAAVQAAIH